MWIICVVLFLFFAVIFTQFYKKTTESMKNAGTLTVLLQFLGGAFLLLFCPFFKFTLPTSPYVYLMYGIACVFYAISDRLNTTVRSGLEASTFSIVNQLTTVFMIIAGLLFFKEPFVLTKVLGASIIILSNVLIFFEKGKFTLNRYIGLAVIANLTYSTALYLDVSICDDFNLAFYAALTLLGPCMIILIGERVRFRSIKEEFTVGNRKNILITSVAWGLLILVELGAYKLGQATVVAPLFALTAILNVIFGYFFLQEKDKLARKLIAGLLTIISVILISQG